jgi:hypothetical protein
MWHPDERAQGGSLQSGPLVASCDPLWDLVDTFRKQWNSEHVQQCNAAKSAANQQCAQQQSAGQSQCTQTRDEGYDTCTQQADDGYNSCSQQADHGYSTCCTWAPCSWFCNALVWISNVVCVAWTWVSNVVCVVWTWVSNVVCVAWTWVSSWVCVASTFVTWAGCRVGTWLVNGIIWMIGGIGQLLCPIYTALLPTYRICATAMQTVSAVPRTVATAFNFATVASRFSYVDEGQRYEFSIDATGAIAFRPDAGTAWQPVAGQSISFDQKRLGVRAPAPQFDMVAADCGRVIGKEKGTERLFFAILDPMFWQFGDMTNPEAGIDAAPAVTRASELMVPSTYFKLDPEENQPGAMPADLLGAVSDPANRQPPFNGHPAAERFNLFKAALAAKSGLIGQFFHGMVVSVEPRLWHLIDARPQKGAGRVPAGIPQFQQVTYCKGSGSSSRQAQCSIAFDTVLDIGAGHAHWHEQYDTSFGGEIQALLSSGASNIPLIAYYQLFNGPVVDRDGFVDGTCNYYLLCHLASQTSATGGSGSCVPLPPDRDTASAAPAQNFALLFLDEQSLFSQRWRLTHPDDNEGLMFALLPDLHHRPNQWGFDVAKFWCPFRAGNIIAQSRMGVSRQVVIVNGVDPMSQQQELYSINFSWATSDFTWRWRAFPKNLRPTFLSAADVQAGTETVDTSQAELVYPQTIRLREDMTCHVRGTQRTKGDRRGIRAGRWFQKYLPADCMAVPSATALTSPAIGQPAAKPSMGYSHPWQFLPEETFQRADQFSHLGVYEPANSRSQYYIVELDKDRDPGAPAQSRWEDQTNQLGIKRAKLDWNVLSGGGPSMLNQVATAFPSGSQALERLVWLLPTQTQDFQSFYTPQRIFLRLAKRDPIGWIATHWDKRDDDLDVFDGIPAAATLTLGGSDLTGAPVLLPITLSSHVIVLNVPQVLQARVVLQLQKDVAIKAVVSFQSVVASQALQSGALTAAGLNKVWENIYTVKIGALPAAGPPIVLFAQDAPAAFTVRAGSDGWFDADWLPGDAGEAAAMARYCSDQGRDEFGTSVWFVDAVGHAGTAETTLFETNAHRGE